MAVPFQQGELQRALQEAARQRKILADALAKLDAVKARRDEIGERLVGMSPWSWGRQSKTASTDLHARIGMAGEEPAPLWALQVLGPRPDRQQAAHV